MVNAALEDALNQAEALLIDRLGAITLAELARDFDVLCKASGWGVEGRHQE